MKNQEAFDSTTTQLVAVMESLSGSVREIAVIFDKEYGVRCEIEDNFDYLEAQKCIEAAIRQIGIIVGSRIAERYI